MREDFSLEQIHYDTWRELNIFQRIVNGTNKSTDLNLTVIMVLYQQKTCTLSKLARIQGIRPSACSSRVTNLVNKGWVSRILNEKNRREVSITLTEKGKQLAIDELERRYAEMKRHFANLPEDVKKDLFDACKVILDIHEKINLDLDK